MSKLIAIPFKGQEEQPEGITMSNNNCIRTKDSSGRSSIMVKKTKLNLNGFEESRTCVITLPASVAATVNPAPNTDISKQLENLFEVGELTIQMKESTTPFYNGQQPKTKGEGGDTIVTPDGELVYGDYCLAPMGTKDVIVRAIAGVSAVAAEEAVAEDGDLA